MVISVINLTIIQEPRLCAHLSVPASMKEFDACLEPSGARLILAATVSKGGAE